MYSLHRSGRPVAFTFEFQYHGPGSRRASAVLRLVATFVTLFGGWR